MDGQEVFLTGSDIYHEGEDRQGLAIALGVLVCILFLTIKGQPAIVPAGYQTSASVASTVDIEVETTEEE